MITAWRPCLGWQTLWWSPRLASSQTRTWQQHTRHNQLQPGHRPLIGHKCKSGPLIGQYWGILTKTFRMSLTCELCVISSGTDAGIVPINTFIVFILHRHNSIIILLNECNIHLYLDHGNRSPCTLDVWFIEFLPPIKFQIHRNDRNPGYFLFSK